MTLPEGQWLSGELPVLNMFDELAGIKTHLLPTNPIERVQTRNRAMVAQDLLLPLRSLFVDLNELAFRTAEKAIVAKLMAADELPWSSAMHVDRIVLAAFSTLTASRKGLLDRWSKHAPTIVTLLKKLAETPLVRKLRTEEYDQQFQAFFAAFGGQYPNLVNAVALEM